MYKRQYVNIAGGMKMNEPALDLAIAMAIISSYKDVPVDEKTIISVSYTHLAVYKRQLQLTGPENQVRKKALETHRLLREDELYKS